MSSAASPLERFKSPTPASGVTKHRKGRSSSECIRKSDGVTLANKRAPAVRIFVMNERGSDDEIATPQKTPRDQLPDDDDQDPSSLGKQWRRKSVNIGSPLPGPQTQASSFYDFVGVIGEGKTSQVYYGVHKKSGEKVAIKVIDRRRLIANPDLVAEVNVLKKVSHPNIIQLKDVFITTENLQIVMELCEGHELFDEIVDRRTFSEVDARDLIREVLQPLSYLHGQGIAHRDLKPENIMFVSEDDKKHIKLLDFGFAKAVEVDGFSNEVSMVGTLGYKAPEIFKREPYTTKCDMWALGVMTYILLCGFPPFFSKEHYKEQVNHAPFWWFFNDETESLIEQIKTGSVAYPDSHWKRLSPMAKTFVQSLLVVDPSKRSDAKSALTHEWMQWQPRRGRAMGTRTASSSTPATCDLANLSISAKSLQMLRGGSGGGGGGSSYGLGGATGSASRGNSRPSSGVYRLSASFPSSRSSSPSPQVEDSKIVVYDPVQESIRSTVERHILGESRRNLASSTGNAYYSNPSSHSWLPQEMDLDDSQETLIDAKYRLLASYDTQAAQLEMLSALDQKELAKYMKLRRGSQGSRIATPPPSLLQSLLSQSSDSSASSSSSASPPNTEEVSKPKRRRSSF